MPVTTILQHAMERQVLVEADLDTRMSNTVDSITFEQRPMETSLDTTMVNSRDNLSVEQRPVETNLDTTMVNNDGSFSFDQRPTEAGLNTTMPSGNNNLTVAQIALDWVKGVETCYPQTSSQPKTNEAAPAAGSWIPPDSTHRQILLNSNYSSNRQKNTQSSSRQPAQEAHYIEQIKPHAFCGEEMAISVPKTIPNGIHYVEKSPPAIDNTMQAYHQTQQGGNAPLTSHYSQPVSTNYNTGETSADFYTTAEAAYNAIRAHNNTMIPLTSHSSEQTSSRTNNSGQTSPNDYHTACSSPTGCNTAQTSHEAHTVVGARNGLGNHAVVSDAHPPTTTHPSITSTQPCNPRPFDAQPIYEQTESVGVPQGGGVLYHTVAPQPTSQLAIASQQTAAVPEVISQPPILPHQMASTQPRRATRSYPKLMPRPAPVSQEAAAAAAVAVQSVYSQPVTVEQPAMNSRPEYPQPTMTTSHAVTTTQPMATPHPMSAPRTAVESQRMTTPWPAETLFPIMSSQPLATSRPPATSQPAYPESDPPQYPYPQHAYSQPPATSGHSYPQPTDPRYFYPQHDYTQPPTAAQRAINRRKTSRHGRNRVGSSQAEINRALCVPEGSSVVEMQPSAGNRVLEYLMQRNPSVVTASRVSNELPENTAKHDNGVLSHQAQMIDPYPLGCSSPSTMESRHARSNGVPSALEVHYNIHNGIPAQHGGIEPATTHVDSTPASRQAQGTEAPYYPGDSGAPTSHNGVQSLSYPIVPPEKVNDGSYSPTCLQCIQIYQGQNSFHNGTKEVSQYDGQAASRGSLDDQVDIQEISREDWQVANRDNSGRKARPRAQSVARPVQQSGPLRPWTPPVQVQESSVQVQEHSVQVQEPRIPALEPHIQAQAPMFVSGSRLMPIPNWAPGRSAEAQAPELVLGLGMRATNEGGENSPMKRQTSYSLPRFGDTFSAWPFESAPSALPSTSSTGSGTQLRP